MCIAITKNHHSGPLALIISTATVIHAVLGLCRQAHPNTPPHHLPVHPGATRIAAQTCPMHRDGSRAQSISMPKVAALEEVQLLQGFHFLLLVYLPFRRHLAVVTLLQGPQQLHARDCWSSVNSSSAQKLSPCQPFGGSPLLHPGERIRDRQLLKRQSTSKNRFRPVSSSSSRANQATAKPLMPFTYHLQAVTQASNSEGQTRKRSSARLPCSWPAQARLPSTTSMRIGSRGSCLPCDQYSSTSSGPKGAACAPRVLSTLPTSRQNALPCLEPVATEICTSICYNGDPCDCRYQIGSLETVIDVLNGLRNSNTRLDCIGLVGLFCGVVLCVCVLCGFVWC